jgi:predicted amidohydrolase
MESIFPETEDPIVAAASEAAARHGVYVHVGSTPIDRGDGKVANRAFLFGPDGRKLASYDKIHMFDVTLADGETYSESDNYQAGSEAVTADLPWGRLGLTICYDVRFPYLHRALAHAGAQILSSPAAFTRTTGEAHWHTLLRARAIENGAFVISAAQGDCMRTGAKPTGIR